MSKTKINLKLIIALFGVALVMCLVPLGVQALATDEATDAAATNNEGEPAAPVNVTTIKFESDYTDDLFTPNDERTFTLDDGDIIISDVVEHVGYLFISPVCRFIMLRQLSLWLMGNVPYAAFVNISHFPSGDTFG